MFTFADNATKVQQNVDEPEFLDRRHRFPFLTELFDERWIRDTGRVSVAHPATFRPAARKRILQALSMGRRARWGSDWYGVNTIDHLVQPTYYFGQVPLMPCAGLHVETNISCVGDGTVDVECHVQEPFGMEGYESSCAAVKHDVHWDYEYTDAEYVLEHVVNCAIVRAMDNARDEADNERTIDTYIMSRGRNRMCCVMPRYINGESCVDHAPKDSHVDHLHHLVVPNIDMHIHDDEQRMHFGCQFMKCHGCYPDDDERIMKFEPPARFTIGQDHDDFFFSMPSGDLNLLEYACHKMSVDDTAELSQLEGDTVLGWTIWRHVN